VPGAWNEDPNKLLNDVEYNIKKGSEILKRYYKRFGSAEEAVQAYNIGETAFKRGKESPDYLKKYKTNLSSLFNL
jgi:soluble lytic murein transglycosylase-like protein